MKLDPDYKFRNKNLPARNVFEVLAALMQQDTKNDTRDNRIQPVMDFSRLRLATELWKRKFKGQFWRERDFPRRRRVKEYSQMN